MDDTGNYIWLFNRKEKGLFKAVLSSLLFHSLLFTLLASTSIFRPMAGSTERLDIVWLYPYLFLGGDQKQAEQVSLAPEQPVEPQPVQQKLATDLAPNADVKEHEAPTKKVVVPPEPPTTAKLAEPAVSVPADEESEPAEEPEMKIPARIEEPPPVKAEEHRADPPKKPAEETLKEKVEPPPVVKQDKPPKGPDKLAAPAKIQEAKQLPPEEKAVVQEKTAPPVKPPVNVPAPSPVQTQKIVAPAPRPTVAKTIIVDEKRAAEKETRPPPVAVAVKPPPVAAVPAQSPSPTPAKASADKVTAKANGEQARQTSEVKGLFMPPAYGDLKLEINGKESDLQRIKVTVVYRDFPPARRSRPLTKAEARRSQTITPTLSRTGKETLQAVIEIAHDGIYDFRLESDKPVEAAFSVKLYEKGNKPRTKSLGRKSVAQKESILKILMPEGILWDDPASFSGSMEDSDSVTRFNTDSGLVWKEYK